MLSRAFWAGLLYAIGLLGTRFAVAEDWLPISPDELHMTREPAAPGAPAVYLYRQIDRDDSLFREVVYVRIKILSDAGLQYANVEIPFEKGQESINSIRARTIRPDGSSINFDGTTYEKPILKSDHKKYISKTFTLPEAEVGSILEYRYVRNLPYGWLYDSHWILSDDLFTRSAKFSFVPNGSYSLIWSWPNGMPPGTDAPKKEGTKIRLETHNVPAMVTEEYMPPENELRYRVDFVYDFEQTPRNDGVAFWKIHGKHIYADIQHFCDKRSAMEKAVAQVVAAGDTPDTKLRKLYARVQQIHNLSYIPESEREASQQQSDAIHNVEDVWNHGYGNTRQISWLFWALARAAGLDAYPVMVATRDRYFFNHLAMNPTELNSDVVLVKMDGNNLFLDPGVPFTPFGLLPWYETSVEALSLDKNGGTWLDTPNSRGTDSSIDRHGTFQLDHGTLTGKVTVTYTGLEAAWRRLDERSEDAAARRKFLEEDLQEDISSGSDVKLTNNPDWDSWDTPLVVEYDVEIPGWAAPAGRRAMFPIGIFGANESHVFEHATRVHPIVFDYCYHKTDDVTVNLPPDWTVENIPKPSVLDLKGLVFEETVESQQHALHVTRKLARNASVVRAAAYDSVRNFYQTVRKADEDAVVLSTAEHTHK